jgi:pimeloyl-ACP methyl ester carboxylesterase
MDGERQTSLYCLAGWGQPVGAIEAFASQLENVREVKLSSTGALFKEARAFSASASQPFVYAHALLEAIKEMPRPRALLAWSMGGLVALDAMTLGLASEIDKLILVNTTARFLEGEDYAVGRHVSDVTTLRAGVQTKPEPALRAFLSLVYSHAQIRHADIQRRVAEALEYGVECLVDGLNYLEQSDFREVLPSIELPVLILHGENDGVMSIGCGEYLAYHLPNSTLEIIPEVDHGFLRDRPELAVPRVNGFLA